MLIATQNLLFVQEGRDVEEEQVEGGFVAHDQFHVDDLFHIEVQDEVVRDQVFFNFLFKKIHCIDCLLQEAEREVGLRQGAIRKRGAEAQVYLKFNCSHEMVCSSDMSSLR